MSPPFLPFSAAVVGVEHCWECVRTATPTPRVTCGHQDGRTPGWFPPNCPHQDTPPRPPAPTQRQPIFFFSASPLCGENDFFGRFHRSPGKTFAQWVCRLTSALLLECYAGVASESFRNVSSKGGGEDPTFPPRPPGRRPVSGHALLFVCYLARSELQVVCTAYLMFCLLWSTQARKLCSYPSFL